MNNLEDMVTIEDCSTVLKNYTKNDKVTYKSHKVAKLESIEGLIGIHCRLKIVYQELDDEKEVNLFLKAINTVSKVMDDMSTSIKAYEREEFFYSYLLSEFKKENLPLNYAPKCYLCRPKIFIMDDLALDGYGTNPKKNMLDIRHCKVGLKTLAKFHATTILYEEIKSKNSEDYVVLDKAYPQYLEDVFTSETRNRAQDWIECTIRGVLSLIDLLPPSDISNEQFQTRVLEILEEIKVAEMPSKCKKTILHGDLWSNNFLFKYENDVPINSFLIDYQILKYGPISIDVVQMVLTNVRRNLREIHFEELLTYYYHELVEYCEGQGFDSSNFLSYIDFMESCNEVKIAMKLQCLADHSITFLIDDTIAAYFETEEGTCEFLFGDRSKSMIRFFQENELYREVLTEDLVELRDMIFGT